MAEDLRQLPGGDAALAFLTKHSGLTAQSYEGALRRFLSWCKRHDYEPLSLRPMHFDLLRREMVQAWGPRTVQVRQSAIAGYYRYLVERGELAASPIPEGWYLKRQPMAQTPPALTADELTKFRAAALEEDGKAAVVVILITDLFMKSSEVCDARVEDFPVGRDGSIDVRGSAFGSIYTVKTLRGPEAEAIKRFVDGRTEGPLLSTELGTPMNRAALVRVLRRVSKQARLNAVTPNDLRKAALAHSLGGYRGELRPSRLRRMVGVAGETSNGEVHPVDFAKELLSISDLLLEDAKTRPVAPVVLTGTAIEYLLRRLALISGSTSSGGGIEAWSGALRSLNVISKQEKKMVAVWAGLRDIAVHDDDTSPLTVREARHMNAEFLEFIERHEAAFE